MLCRSPGLCFSPPLRVSLWRHWGDPREAGRKASRAFFLSSLPFPSPSPLPLWAGVSRNGCISSLCSSCSPSNCLLFVHQSRGDSFLQFLIAPYLLFQLHYHFLLQGLYLIPLWNYLMQWLSWRRVHPVWFLHEDPDPTGSLLALRPGSGTSGIC